jgi:ribose 5-phosphate isomerase B
VAKSENSYRRRPYRLRFEASYNRLQKVKEYCDNRLCTHNEERTDYPIYAKKVAEAVVSGEYDAGILVCGTGVGISIAANKVERHPLCCFARKPTAQSSRGNHNNANVLAFGSRVIGTSTAEAMLTLF